MKKNYVSLVKTLNESSDSWSPITGGELIQVLIDHVGMKLSVYASGKSNQFSFNSYMEGVLTKKQDQFVLTNDNNEELITFKINQSSEFQVNDNNDMEFTLTDNTLFMTLQFS